MIKIVTFIFLLTFRFSFAQTDSITSIDSAKYYKLNILSNLENAKIILDTASIGVTPLVNHEIKKGTYKIKVINPKSLKDWQNENQLIDITINNDTTININFKYYYFFNTVPFDARVFQKDSLLGYTPLRFFSDNELTGGLIFKKKDYKDFNFDLKSYDFEYGANITLKPKGSETINDAVYKNRGTQFETRRDLIPILTCGVAAIAGGYFAINFKNKANNEYSNYLFNGNSASLNSSNRNDTYFVISLVLMQAAVGGLIYFLFFDK